MLNWDTIPGTEFQKQVWRAVQRVPLGQTATYLDIAKKIKQPMAVRAVGSAIKKNPCLIIIPCHRVVRSDGDIGQYSGRIWRKRWLLAHENSKK